MKKTIKLLTIFALLGSVLPVWAGEYKTREIANAPAFTAIEISGADAEVIFSQGKNHSISVKGLTKSVKATKISIKNNTLFINYKEPFIFGDDNLTIRISAPELKKISVSGEADFKSNNNFQGEELTIKTHQDGEVSMKGLTVNTINIDSKGTSSVDLEYIEADTIRANAYDRAEIELSGRANTAELNQKSTFAEIDAKKLRTTRISGNNTGNTPKQVNKNGAIEFEFND